MQRKTAGLLMSEIYDHFEGNAVVLIFNIDKFFHWLLSIVCLTVKLVI